VLACLEKDLLSIIQQQSNDFIRINARKTDIFDIFDLRYYIGLSSYLDRGALVFDFALTGYGEALKI
jgi:cyanophycin synthetase